MRLMLVTPTTQLTQQSNSLPIIIVRSQRQEFLNALPKDSFFSLLMDGTTDVAVVEDELIVIVYCNIDDVDEEITSTIFVSPRPTKS